MTTVHCNATSDMTRSFRHWQQERPALLQHSSPCSPSRCREHSTKIEIYERTNLHLRIKVSGSFGGTFGLATAATTTASIAPTNKMIR